ncbi:MAG TPA: universal stress protein [Dehalococcoidia bacterium]|nr:universal stress protein [Dehalococcoidia bacterium]
MRLLVTLDGSAMCEVVLGPAADLAQSSQAEVRLYSVLNRYDIAYLSLLHDRLGNPPPPDEKVVEAEARLLREVREMLADKADAFISRGVTADFIADVGSPADLIVAQARDWGADLIAMATHGRSGLIEQLLGSVSSSVLRSGVAPVLLVWSGRG